MAGLLRKGQTPSDVILGIVIIVMLAIGAIASTYMYDRFYERTINESAFNASNYSRYAFQQGQAVNDMWDYVILFLFLGFGLALVIIGYFIDVNSIFFPLFIIGLIVGVIVAAIMGYVWEQVADSATFSAVKTEKFPITDHLMVNLALYFTVLGAMSMIATYAKTRNEV